MNVWQAIGMEAQKITRDIYIGIIGTGEEDPVAVDLAHEAGRLVGARGAVLICGGLGGVMNAASRGAKEANGITIGILPGKERAGASAFLDYSIPTGLGEVRNAIIVSAADGLIAIGGGYGTLSEIGFALKSGKPLVGLRTWSLFRGEEKANAFPEFSEPLDAVEAVFGMIASGYRRA